MSALSREAEEIGRGCERYHALARASRIATTFTFSFQDVDLNNITPVECGLCGGQVLQIGEEFMSDCCIVPAPIRFQLGQGGPINLPKNLKEKPQLPPEVAKLCRGGRN